MSRDGARSRSLRQRRSRTVPASIVAVVLLAVGVLAAVAGISRLAAGVWPSQVSGPAQVLASLAWGSAAALTTAAVVATLGVVLMVAGLKPGGYTSATLDAGAAAEAVDETDYVISNRAMAWLAATAASNVDAVDKVSVTASGRRVEVSVQSSSTQTAQISQRVRDAVTQALADARIAPSPQVGATVRTKEI